MPGARDPVNGSLRFRVVVAAASAGGLSALATVLHGLPSDFGLPIAIVQHIDPTHASRVADILARRTVLHVKEAESGDILMPAGVYVAPPDAHMLVVAGGGIRLSHEEPVRYLRPAADRLFMSAADAFGPAIAVILTGTGADGADGAAAVKAGGGLVIAQDETTSQFFGMPHAAIERGFVDVVLPLTAIAGALVQLAGSRPA